MPLDEIADRLLGDAQVARRAVADLEGVNLAGVDELAELLPADLQPGHDVLHRPALPGIGVWLGDLRRLAGFGFRCRVLNDSPAERADLAAIARAQRGAVKRASALALVVFGAGAALRPGELAGLRGCHVTRRSGQVVVEVAVGPAPRVVRVAVRYAGRALDLAREAGTGFVFRPGPAGRAGKNFVNMFAQRLARDPSAPALSASRCRASFICDHLAAGTPLGELLAIAGIAEAESLARYAAHVPGLTASKAALRARWHAERAR